MDFYFNSWRLVPANLLWGLCAVIVYLALLASPAIGLLLAPLLVLPTAGVFRLAALVARAEPAAFSDALDQWREGVVTRLAIGLAATLAGLVLVSNLTWGLASGDPVGWALATFAAWGLASGWCWLWTFWALLLDPLREGRGARYAARLAAYLLIAHPVRLLGLGLALGLFLALSAVAFSALLMVSVSYAALVGCRYLLPAADRLEEALAARTAS